MSAAPLLEISELTRIFGSGKNAVRAIWRASFSMQPGEVMGVVGESGSGKTTLARMLLGLLEPTSGRIVLDGADVTRLHGTADRRAYWQRVQAVFQDPFSSFNQFFRVGRVLWHALDVCEPSLSDPERHGRVDAALVAVGLDPAEIVRRWPHELSGGQRQRVMIARALVVEPQLLIADEPTSMLDASLRATVLNVLLDVRARRTMGMLFITHDIGQAAYVSDRLLVMYRGEIVEHGVPEQVLWSPRHSYTRRLMADVPRLRTAQLTIRQ